MHHTLTALLALPLLLTAASSACAQTTRYCNGLLVANSAFINVASNGHTSQVDYHALLQNQDPRRQALRATLVAPQHIGAFRPQQIMSYVDLVAYEQKTVRLLSIAVNNPSGSGAPTPQQLLAAIRFTCVPK